MGVDELRCTLSDLRKTMTPLTHEVVDDPEEILVDLATDSESYIDALDEVIDFIGFLIFILRLQDKS